MHQKNATFDIKTATFATSDKIPGSSTPCKASLGEDGGHDDKFDEEFLQIHEFGGVSKCSQTKWK